MDLVDAIGWILSSISEPLSISEVTAQINTDYLGEPVKGAPVDEEAVRKCISKNKESFDLKYGIVVLKGEDHPVEKFEKGIYDILDVMRGYFKMEMAGLLILPQVFIFRLYQLSKEDHLPDKFRNLELHKMELKNLTDLCGMMNRISNADIEEVNGSMNLFLNEFEPLIGEDTFEKIFKRLKNNNYSIHYLNEKQFGKLYSSLIRNIFGDSLYRGEYLTSDLIKEIFSSIKFPLGSYKVMDPTFGIGSSIIELLNNQREGVNIQVHGFELHNETYCYAVMNLISNGIYSFKLNHGDCLENKWKTSFDLIISDPPINLKKGDSNLIKKTRIHLKENGRACILVSDGILHHRGMPEQERRQWIDQRLVKKVISFPEGVGKENSNISINLLYLVNRKGSGNNVEFYDFNTEYNALESELKDSAKKIFSPFKFDSSYYQKIQYDKLLKNEYNLLPRKYVGQIHEQVEHLKRQNKVAKLDQFLRLAFKEPTSPDCQRLSNKLLKARDLKDDPFNGMINSSEFNSNYNLPPQKQLSLIDENVLLIAQQGEDLKPTYLKCNDHSILIDQSIYAFKIIGKVIKEYLLYQLHTDFFQEQLKRVQNGGTIKRLFWRDFLDLYIKLPNFNGQDYRKAQEEYLKEKKQEAYEKAYKEKKKETEELKKKLNVAEDEKSTYQDIQEEELIDYMNHNVRNKLSPVKDSLELLYDFMVENEGNPIDLKALEGIPLEGESKSDLNTINDLFMAAKRGLENALHSLKRLEDFRQNEYKPEDFEEINLFEWLKRDVQQRSKEYKIEVVTKETKAKEVFNTKIVKPAFRDLIDNLLENAERHGFDKDKKNYTILFELSISNGSIVIDYKNDGKPMNRALNKKKFTSTGGTAGKNKGKGFGGFFINRTIRKHGGSFEIASTTTESKFKVHFKINLPVNSEV